MAFMAGTFTTPGQYAWTYESLYDNVADSSGLGLSFGQFEQTLLPCTRTMVRPRSRQKPEVLQ